MEIHLGEAGGKDDEEGHLRLPRVHGAWPGSLAAWKASGYPGRGCVTGLLSEVTSLSGFSWSLSKTKNEDHSIF